MLIATNPLTADRDRLATRLRVGAEMALRTAESTALLGRARWRGRSRDSRLAQQFVTTDFDPVAPEVIDDPVPAYRTLLAGPPVVWSLPRRSFVISHYPEVERALRTPDVFSSADGVLPVPSRLPTLLTMDRPDHTRLRRLVARDFGRTAIERWGEDARRYADQGIMALLEDPGADAVALLTSPLPVWMIADLLGVPQTERPTFRGLSNQSIEVTSFEPGFGGLRSVGRSFLGGSRLMAYLGRHAERLCDGTGDNILSRLAASSQDGNLSDDELAWFALLLLIAGNETTTNLLSTLLLEFARAPDQYELLRAEPARIEAAIDEGLRFGTPIQGFFRTVTTDHEVAGMTLPAGTRALLSFAAANRDPRRWHEPDTFDITRTPQENLAFGAGIHKCLGFHLARLEARVMLEELVEHVGQVELTGPPIFTRSALLRGPAELPLRLVPA